MKNYAVLYAPEIRLQATLRYSPNLVEEPVALLEAEGGKSRICELNPAAQSHQVKRGMTPTQALARCPKLHFIQANTRHEWSAQEALLQTAENLSPFLESTMSGVVTLELPAERFFGEGDFREKIIVPLQAFGLDVRIGVAATPDLALLAARFAHPVKIICDAAAFLAPLPVGALQPNGELATVLESWGIRSVGQFLILPTAQVWERLGTEGVQFWERAKGGRSRPLKLVKPSEYFTEQADLEHPMEMLEPLLFLLRRFLEQIVVRLAHVYLAAGKLRLVLRFGQGKPYQHIFTLPRPTQDVSLLFRMLHTHLENFSSNSPIVGLELAAKPVRPNAEQFDLLDRGLRDPHRFAETLARLEGLLGPGRVGRAMIDSSHHPEAFHLRPYALQASPCDQEEALLIGVPWLRFRPPIPARVVLNDAQPTSLQSACSTGPIKELHGPWRLEGHWWEGRQWSREEWDIATDDGIYRLLRDERNWFLDGIYA